jgi:uncharacterized protein YndB with AHSA1/START domain
VPRTDRASLVIAAPLERVYAALVDPEALVAWLPPDGMSASFERFDARPGGSYRMVLTYADASAAAGKATADSDAVEARFVDIVADSLHSVDQARRHEDRRAFGDRLTIGARDRQLVRCRARSTMSSTWWEAEAAPAGRARFSWTSMSHAGEPASAAAKSSTRT